MRTTKPIATISFNTKEYLIGKLKEMEKAKIISAWHVMSHKAEDDEGGKKDHHHVWIEPSKMVQTEDLRDMLKEFDPSHPDKPLGVLPFTSSRFDPWYLYVLHDKRYLASKGQSRKFHYRHDDIVTSDQDNLTFMVKNIDMTSLSLYADMEDAIKQGVTFSEYFARGTVPLPQIANFEKAWLLLAQHIQETYRNGRSGHPDEAYPDDDVNDPDDKGIYDHMDLETGEIIDFE